MKYLFKASAIINFIVAGIMSLIAMSVFIAKYFSNYGLNSLLIISLSIAVFLALSGFLYLNYSKLEEKQINDKRGLILVLGVATLFVNIVSGLLLLIIFDKMGVKHKKEKLPAEQEKNVALKIGVIFILLAGLFFTLTKLTSAFVIYKCGLLLLVGLFFVWMSFVFDKKNKDQRKVLFWVIGVIYVLFAFLSLGTLKSENFIYGSSQLWFLTSISFVATVIAYLTYWRFKDKTYLSVIAMGSFATIGFLLGCLGLDFVSSILILVILLLFSNNLFKNAILIKIANLFTVILSYVLVFYLMINGVSGYEYIIMTGLFLVLFYMLLAYVRKDSQVSALLTIIILIGAISYVLGSQGLILASIMYSMLYVILMKSGKMYSNKKFEIAFTIIFNIILLILYLLSISKNLTIALLVSLLLLLPTTVNNFLKNKSKIEYYMIPIKLILLTIAAVLCIGNLFSSVVEVTGLFILCVCYFVMLFGYYISKNERLKLVYFCLFELLLISGVLAISASSPNIPALVILASSVVPVIICNNSKDSQYKKLSLLVFIFMMVAIYHILVTIGLLGRLDNIVVFLLYLIIILGFKGRKDYLLVGEILIILPLINFLRSPLCIEPVKYIIAYSLVFYVICLLNKFFAKSDNVKKMVYIIASTLVLLLLVLRHSLFIGLFVILVSMLLMLKGISDKKYSSLFIIGFIFLCIAGFDLLSGIWFSIPIWFYLLILGIVLLLYIMFKNKTE